MQQKFLEVHCKQIIIMRNNICLGAILFFHQTKIYEKKIKITVFFQIMPLN